MTLPLELATGEAVAETPPTVSAREVDGNRTLSITAGIYL